MQKPPVKKMEMIKEMKQLTQKVRPECMIKKRKTLSLILDYLHEILRVYFERFIKIKTGLCSYAVPPCDI
jgi:hypothetical protein